ncbi:MAG: cysteine desulfurase family protein (TIGR01976 family) [Saprospiraceae bacterium]|jgi:cysteine desulfurase family protein (TIGR01976 family)
MKLDNPFVRSCFPAFEQANLKDWAFFENAGGSYACAPVINALNDYYLTHKLQPNHAFPAALEAGELMDSSKRRMAEMLNVATSEVHFGPSTSQNTFNLAQALGDSCFEGDEIIVTNQDHEANIGVWRKLEQRGLVLKQWSVSAETGELDIADLRKLLNEKTKAVAFTHCSNIVASINPVREITDLVHSVDAITIVDGVSFCPHGLPDVKALGADVYIFSLYKVYGPHLGVMVLSDELNKNLPHQSHFFLQDNPAYRFTPAGPDHAQIAAVNGVIDYIDNLYTHHYSADNETPNVRANKVLNLFQQHEHEILQPLLDYLDSHDQLNLIGKTDATLRAPTVSFTSKKMDALSLTKALAEHKIMTGSGDFYAYRLVESLGFNLEQGVCRASMVHYNNAEEVDRLIEALEQIHS